MERYKGIIEDWQEFREEIQKPARTAIRRNRIKASEDFSQRLEHEFGRVEQSDWNTDVYRLETDKPGKSTLYWRGDFYVQEESATLPVKVLSPENGDRVLDMCAAPGGKTTQIVSELENSGVVYANEKSGNRMRSLHANVNRTGSACVKTFNKDGRNFPDRELDKILVDAPCSGEGNNCRRSGESSGEDEREHLARLQFQLMERASELVKDGGTVVYSTCTFAPEENEEVALRVQEETELDLLEIQTDAPHRRGVASFRDKTYSKDAEKTVRVYPHHMQSGGMYVAKFRK
jgi:NOL1/NOP2/sun family putative RNA methylase